MNNSAARNIRPLRVIGVGLTLLALFGLIVRRVLGIVEKQSWPPGADAITPDAAQSAAERFASRPTTSRDVDVDYAWSTAATIEPWAEGTTFYPLIADDVRAAASSIHILMFGWKPGEVGDTLTDILVEKLASGVEVRAVVDGVGSRPVSSSREMYDRLVAAGAEVVVNDMLPVARRGRLPDRSFDWHQTDVGRADHRKLYVIDGTVAWTGGAGIEDHFNNGEFYDVMVRVTGDVVRQAQHVFLTSFSGHGADLPGDLGMYFPDQPDVGSVPIAITQVVPGGHLPATQAAREMIDGATTRLDMTNPYLTDRDMIERLIGAAHRGVSVRVVISEQSNNALAAAATRHRFADLIDAGVELYEYPGAVVHAKLIVADDVVQFGTLNLDAWALYRNFEIAMIARSPEVAGKLEQRVFDVTVGRSKLATPPNGAGRSFSHVADKLTYFL